MLQAEMNAHPECEIHLEMSELPDDLRATLDNLAAHGRLRYTIVPRLSSVTDRSPSSDSTA
jgi:hypothetical protein